MDDARITLGIVACLATFASCAARLDQVKEVGPGTYSVGIGHSFGGVAQEAAAINEAVSKAGEYCHAKGQKLQTMLNHENEGAVTFRCVSDEVAPPNEQTAH
jgi:hypothetical protein